MQLSDAAGHAPTDADLLADFRQGNAAALGVLLERHLASLRGSAIRKLGARGDADDAVQETFLIALTHIGGVRDPQAVAGWLHAVLGRVCLQMRRKVRREVPALPSHDVIGADASDIESRIDRRELRDWIWRALAHLSEPLRVTAMLRYFGSYDSYDELAAILGVPIGTIRSRIAEARTRLADSLLATATSIDDTTRIVSGEKARFWSDAFDEIYRRGDSARFITHFQHDLLVGWSKASPLRGRQLLADEIEGDLDRRRSPRGAARHCQPRDRRRRGALRQSRRRSGALSAGDRDGALASRGARRRDPLAPGATPPTRRRGVA